MVCDSFLPSVTTSLAAANRPMDLIFDYLHFSQYAHPMGSGRPQWADGEYDMSHTQFCCTFHSTNPLKRRKDIEASQKTVDFVCRNIMQSKYQILAV